MLKLYKLASALLLACAMVQTQAAANKIEIFDNHSWQRMQKDLPRPAAVIFSTTDCSHCPAIIATMVEQIKNHKPQVPLIVVVMDGDGQADLLQEPHYLPASRLFVFKGQTAALQYGVNPSWRGITPYVALLPHRGETKLVLGKPSALEMENWLDVSKMTLPITHRLYCATHLFRPAPHVSTRRVRPCRNRNQKKSLSRAALSNQ